jgi:hypothetical protein
MIVTVVLLLILVQVLQTVGDKLVVHFPVNNPNQAMSRHSLAGATRALKELAE